MMEFSQEVFEQGFSSEKMENLESELSEKTFYIDWIDNLDCNVKVKQILKDTLDLTIQVGKKIYQFGKMILKAVISFAKKWPHLTEGLLLALVLSLLIDSIPFLGPHLNVLLRPLLLLVGGLTGLAVDIYTKAMDLVREMFC